MIHLPYGLTSWIALAALLIVGIVALGGRFRDDEITTVAIALGAASIVASIGKLLMAILKMT